MAQKVSVLLVDDIDGSEARETISFGLDGTRYEIDLNGEHTQELREQLGRYVKAARKVTGSPASGHAPGFRQHPYQRDGDTAKLPGRGS